MLCDLWDVWGLHKHTGGTHVAALKPGFKIETCGNSQLHCEVKYKYINSKFRNSNNESQEPVDTCDGKNYRVKNEPSPRFISGVGILL